jgi:hypothetical protein
MLGRIFPIVAGYLLGCAAAGVLVVLGFAAPRLIDDLGASFHLGIMSLMAAAVIVVVLACSALPAFLTVIYAERTGKRSAGFYAAAGALNGLLSFVLYCMATIWRSGAAPTLARDITAADGMIRLAGGLALFALAGILAGLVYWAVAGRRAGLAP